MGLNIDETVRCIVNASPTVSFRLTAQICVFVFFAMLYYMNPGSMQLECSSVSLPFYGRD
jgi:hypothetical protein